MTTNKQDYIYRDMPVEIWEGFKSADSFGSYYNLHIKGKWLMVL
ncbi:MAG: KTSC domain-containing protein [Bacteroidetes bacterium]|nr:KTSC domain-containing protein [Bacteroidota bacterium]